MIAVCVIQNPPRFRTEHRDHHRATHRHFVAAWIPVKTPHKVNAKTNLFPRKRDAVDVVPYGHETNFVRTCYPVYTMFVVCVIHKQSRFCRGRSRPPLIRYAYSWLVAIAKCRATHRHFVTESIPLRPVKFEPTYFVVFVIHKQSRFRRRRLHRQKTLCSTLNTGFSLHFRYKNIGDHHGLTAGLLANDVGHIVLKPCAQRLRIVHSLVQRLG